MSNQFEKPAPRDQNIDDVIAECVAAARAAVGELLAIIRSFIYENQELRDSASPGFARRPHLILKVRSPSGSALTSPSFIGVVDGLMFE